MTFYRKYTLAGKFSGERNSKLTVSELRRFCLDETRVSKKATTDDYGETNSNPYLK